MKEIVSREYSIVGENLPTYQAYHCEVTFTDNTTQIFTELIDIQKVEEQIKKQLSKLIWG